MSAQLLNYSAAICRAFRGIDLLLLQTCGAAMGSVHPILAAIILRLSLKGLKRELHDDPVESSPQEKALILILQVVIEFRACDPKVRLWFLGGKQNTPKFCVHALLSTG